MKENDKQNCKQNETKQLYCIVFVFVGVLSKS